MNLKLDYSNMMQENVGAGGMSAARLAELKPAAAAAFRQVQDTRGQGMQGWMSLPYQTKEQLAGLVDCAKRLRENFDNFVLLGIGGSALGPSAVFSALKKPFHNELSRTQRGGVPKFYCLDNIDPEHMNALFGHLDLEKTVFNVVTKSGATGETMSQMLIVCDMLKKRFGTGGIKKHLIATTSETKGNLIKVAKELDLETFFIPEGVGGRFSQLCPVGLLPAAVLNIDIFEMLRGAADCDALCSKSEPEKNPALLSAVLQHEAMQRGCNISVMMPYCDSLKYFADWYAQLWGESLGKAQNLSGRTVNVGQTPVKALGVTDQHSQLQLYAEGPFDKVLTFLEVEQFASNIQIAGGMEQYPDVAFLSGHSMEELLKSELAATKHALTRQNRLNYSIILPRVNAYYIGQLLQYFMLTTAYAGALLGIDTYNQPGVEEGKNITYALLGRKGYEQKRAELEKSAQNKKNFVI